LIERALRGSLRVPAGGRSMSDTVVDGAEDQQHSRAPARSARALADRYVALWNESDGEARRSLIRELWTSTGEHVLDPPHELKEASAALGFASPTLEVRGHEAVETRAARAYEEFIAPGEYAFRLRDNVASLRNVVKFNWDMVATASGDVVGSGLEIIVLDDAGGIVVDYQFIETSWDTVR
jgi:hypothetical protein